jgi:hypothetical protein
MTTIFRYNLALFDGAVRNLALAQIRVPVRAVMLTLEPNGDVTASHISVQPGARSVPYARIHRLTGKLEKLDVAEENSAG